MKAESDPEVEKALHQVEMSKVEINHAIKSIEDSLKETSQKVKETLGGIQKYPGLVWIVTGAIGAQVILDFFTNRVDSNPSRGYNSEIDFTPRSHSDRA